MASDSRAALIEAGIALMLERGYSAAGLSAVLERTELPKGSFYHHFESKQQFAIATLDAYFAREAELLERSLTRETPVRGALRAYFAALADRLEASGWREGCLLGTVGQEVSPSDEVLRARIDGHLASWAERIARALDEGRRRGEIAAECSPEVLGSFLVDAWEGALVRAKVARSREPLERFCELTIDTLLDPATGRRP